MYLPNSLGQFYDILSDLQHYSEIEGLPDLAETLADAKVQLAEAQMQIGRIPCPPRAVAEDPPTG